MAAQQYYINWIDAQGRFIQTSCLWDTFVGSPDGPPGALKFTSNAGLSYYSFGPRRFDETTEPGIALYPSVTDIASLTYSDDAGNLANIIIPAPLANLFELDQITIDPTSIGMVALNSTLLNGALLTKAGGTVTRFLNGLRQGRKTS